MLLVELDDLIEAESLDSCEALLARVDGHLQPLPGPHGADDFPEADFAGAITTDDRVARLVETLR